MIDKLQEGLREIDMEQMHTYFTMKIPRIIRKMGLAVALSAILSCSTPSNDNQGYNTIIDRNPIPFKTLVERTVRDVERDIGIKFTTPITITNNNTMAWPHYGDGTIYYPLNEQTQGLDPSQIIRHELGHMYADQIRKNSETTPLIINGKEVKLREFIESTPYRDKIDQMIEEGIGMYFQKGLTENGNSLHEFEDNLITANPYKLGFSLVDPLIDTYGSKAIRYLVHEKPITARSVADLISYQQESRSQLGGMK